MEKERETEREVRIIAYCELFIGNITSSQNNSDYCRICVSSHITGVPISNNFSLCDAQVSVFILATIFT